MDRAGSSGPPRPISLSGSRGQGGLDPRPRLSRCFKSILCRLLHRWPGVNGDVGRSGAVRGPPASLILGISLGPGSPWEPGGRRVPALLWWQCLAEGRLCKQPMSTCQGPEIAGCFPTGRITRNNLASGTSRMRWMEVTTERPGHHASAAETLPSPVPLVRGVPSSGTEPPWFLSIYWSLWKLFCKWQFALKKHCFQLLFKNLFGNSPPSESPGGAEFLRGGSSPATYLTVWLDDSSSPLSQGE
ncbi:uncharacterized protein LOC121346014 [Onychostruthus taczanowskii]|uniref:uncharacterized protein LOC121346014 n=1 Tax=Onychostruthus taczanowskii TaxID=356909 RepID=UPI001B8001EA|nr:uncharacterized protein LOC121346014 [Onychostruthus taczanowskii]